MSTARIILSPPPVVRLMVEDGPAVRIELPAPAQLRVITEGIQGPRGLPGQDAAVIDPGDLILYLENGMT